MNASKNLFSEPMVELSWIYGLLIIFFLFAIISLVRKFGSGIRKFCHCVNFFQPQFFSFVDTQFLWRNKRVAKISSS